MYNFFTRHSLKTTALKKVGWLRFVFLVLVGFLLSGSQLRAATITSAGSGSWNSSTTWVGGILPAIGDNVIITAGHRVVCSARINLGLGSFTINGVLDLTSELAVGSLNGSGFIGSTLVGATPCILTVGSNNTSTVFAGSLLNNIELIKKGTGTLTISGVNCSVGNTSVDAGTLRVGVAGGFISNNHVLTVNTGAFFDLNGFVETVGSLSGNGRITSSVAGSACIEVNYTMAIGAAFSGIIQNGSGTVSFTKSGSGIFTLTGNNTYTGVTTINGGTLEVSTITNGGVSGNLGASAAASANLVINGGTLSVTSAGTVITNRGMTLQNVAGNTILFTGTNLTIGGVMAGAGGFLKTGSGTLTLSGANTYSGAATVLAGTLQLGASGVIPDGSALILNGGNFRSGATNGFNETLGTLTISTNSTITLGTGVHTLTFANSSAAIWTAGITVTIAGWAGTGGSSGTAGKIFVGNSTAGLSTTQQGITSFSGYLGTSMLLSTGEWVPKLPTTYTWNATSGSSSWTSPGSWSPSRSSPSVDDVLLFSNGGSSIATNVPTATVGQIIMSGSTSVSLQPAVSGNTITIKGNAGVDLSIPTSSSLTIGNGASIMNLSFTGSGHQVNISGTLNLNNSNVNNSFNTANSTTTISSGTLNNGASLLGNIVNNGQVNFTRTDTHTFSGVISGTGSFIKSGAGILSLWNSNTYTGMTTISAGTLRITSSERISNSSALNIGAGATVDLFGFSETVASLSGSGVIRTSVAGTSTITHGGASSSTFSGIIQNGTGILSLAKSGISTLTLNVASTYSGPTVISAGVLQLGAANILPDASTVVFNGGNLRSGITNGFNETMGTMQVTASSSIALGTGVFSLNFANSNAVAWTGGANLTINGWTGTPGASGTSGKIFIGTTAAALTPAQLDKIFFNGYGGAMLLPTGELVPKTCPMVLEVVTSTPGEEIELPLGGSVNATVDWGDGSPADYYSTAGIQSHIYATAGTYAISISGTLTEFGNIIVSSSEKYSRVVSWGCIGLTSLHMAFTNAVNLTDVPDNLPATVTNLKSAFQNTISLNDPDFVTWNTANVTDMSSLFFGASIFNQPIGGWNTANVTDMSGMFAYAYDFNQPIGSWNTAKVTNMASMFTWAQNFDQPLNTWNTGAVTNMSFMFNRAHLFNHPIGSWNTANVTNMSNMFANTTVFDQPIASWNTANVTNMAAMFFNAFSFNQPLASWNTSNVNNMSQMFYSTSSFNQPIGSWNTINVTSMRQMFSFAVIFDQPIGSWNTINVTDMNEMFNGAFSFNQPLATWNTSNVRWMSLMFAGGMFNQPINNWVTSSVIDMSGMFSSSYFDQPINSWNTGNVTDMSLMFYNNIVFNQPLRNWNTSKVMDMNQMFRDATEFDRSVGAWNIGNVANMDGMFQGICLSPVNYDSILNGWAAQAGRDPVILFHGGYSNYTATGDPGRNSLLSTPWSIIDGGLASDLYMTSAAGTDSQIVTLGNPIIDITYNFPGGDGVIINGLPDGVVYDLTPWPGPGILTIYGIPNITGVFTFSDACGAISGTIIVSNCSVSNPSVEPKVCLNSVLSPFIHITTGAVGIDSVVGLPPGTKAIWSNDTIIIDGTPTADGIYNYSIYLSGDCFGLAGIGTIIVLPLPAVSASSNSPACTGGSLELTGSPGTLSGYQWTGPNGYSASTQSSSIVNPGMIAAGNYILTAVNGDGCEGSDTIAVTIVSGVSGQWIGSVSTDWHNAANWCDGVPLSTTNATLPAGTPYSPHITALATCRNLTIANAQSLTISGSGDLQLYGDLVRAGSFIHTGGVIQFLGSLRQTIDGINAFNVTLNNPLGITLQGHLTVQGTLTLTNGVIETLANRVIVRNNHPAAVTIGSTTAYVNGNLTRALNKTTGTGVYHFPVGTSGHYELATIDFTSNPTIDSLTAFFTGTNFGCTSIPASAGGPFVNGTALTNLLNCGFWTITPNTTTYSGVNYTITLNARGYSGAPSTPMSFAVVKRESCTIDWTSTGIHLNSTQAISGGTITAVRSSLTAFSDFGIGFMAGALPIDLVRFDVGYANNQQDALLTWTTASEVNNDYFEIEVSSDIDHPGRLFRPLGRVKGSGNSTALIHYDFMDAEQGKSGLRYYRIKQMDYDGAFTYSDIKSLRFNVPRVSLSSLYPNPVISTLNFTIQSEEDVETQVTINNAAGQEIFREQLQLGTGTNTFQFLLSDLASGMYQFIVKSRLADNQDVHLQQNFIKQ